MADQLQDILRKLQQSPRDYKTSSDLLSKAKLILLKSKALTPQPSTPSALLPLAREVYETGALVSIRNKDTEAFTRYFNLLTPFYELPADRLSGDRSQKNKITGLYLLLLLTMGNYSGFYIARESMAVRKEDQYAGYPIKLESWLQEGRYDQAWKMITSREIPSEEYGVFSEILASQIRSEIASNAEAAYPSLPVASSKDLLFLDSEGAVVEFAQSRGWEIADGRIYFPTVAKVEDEGEQNSKVIADVLQYTGNLEKIV